MNTCEEKSYPFNSFVIVFFMEFPMSFLTRQIMVITTKCEQKKKDLQKLMSVWTLFLFFTGKSNLEKLQLWKINWVR